MKTKYGIRGFETRSHIESCKAELQVVDQIITQLARALIEFGEPLNLAGSPVRLKIVYLLHLEEELCVSDFGDILVMNSGTVYNHLCKLKDGRLIQLNPINNRIFYSLTEEFQTLFAPFFEILDYKNGLEEVL